MSTRGRMAAWALLLAPAAASAGAGSFDCPATGGPPWREVRTAHVAVQTDLDSSEAQDLARQVEQLYQAVRHALFKDPPEAARRVRVVSMRAFQLALYAPRDAGAFYTPAMDLGPAVVLPGYLGDAQRPVLAHELTHQVLARVFPRQPRWFAEGMASYMETVGPGARGGRPTMGSINMRRFRAAFPYHGGMAKVLTFKGMPDERGYGMAWALVFFLAHQRPAEFGQLQVRFARGQDPSAAWREVFPAWDPATPAGGEALDDAVGRYLGSRQIRTAWEFDLPPPGDVAERALTVGEVHAIRLSLPWFNRGDGKAVARDYAAEVDEALEHDPGNVVALRRLALRKGQEGKALELAERAVAVHGDDARAWIFLAESLPRESRARRLEVLTRAAELDPANATALNDLAWDLIAEGRSGEALPLARRAVAVEPTNAAAIDTLAAALEDLGRCADALAVQHRAVEVLPEWYDEAARRPYLGRLARLEKGCGAEAAPPSTPAPAPGAPPARGG